MRAGTRLAGPYHFLLDGIQGDADFIAALFALKRNPALYLYNVKVSLFEVGI